MRINTNISSIQAQRNVRQISGEVESSSKALASGSRINSASDDAAGLAISEKLKSTIRSANQAKRNANDGISILQTIEGSLGEAQSIFARLKELSIQSASDTLENEHRQMANHEFGQMKMELKRIISTIRANGVALKFGNDDKIKRQMMDASIDTIDFHVGVDGNKGNSRITFNPSDLILDDNDFRILNKDISTKQGARSVISEIDQDIALLSTSRAHLGAIQNRLSSAADNLSTRSVNESQANSVIKDADYAYETAHNMKSKMVMEASTSVLAQVNGIGKHMLKLVE